MELKRMIKGSIVVVGTIAIGLAGVQINGYRDNIVSIAKAESMYSDIGITYIDSISSYNTYVPKNIQYTYINGQGASSIIQFKLESCTAIKVSINNITAYGFTGGQREDTSIQASIYSDPSFVNKIQELGEASKGSDLYSKVLYLDPGTYYIKSDQTSSTLEDTTISYNVGIVGEASISNEQSFPSTYNNPNEIELNRRFKGFVSGINPVDWYRFKVDNEGMVKVSLNVLSGDMNAIVSLYNSLNDRLVQTDLAGSYNSINIERYLKKGIYYISIENTGSEYGGQVSGIVKCEGYAIKATKSNNAKTNKDIEVKLDYNFSPSAVVIVDGNKVKVTMSNKDSNEVWSRAITDTSILEIAGGNSFLIKKNGNYVVLAKDSIGNTAYKKVSITNIDKKAPGKPVITKAKRNTKYVYGKAEAGSKVTVKYTVTRVGKDGVSGIKSYTYKGKAKANQSFKIKTLKLRKGMKIYVTATDSVGNCSREAVYVIR